MDFKAQILDEKGIKKVTRAEYEPVLVFTYLYKKYEPNQNKKSDGSRNARTLLPKIEIEKCLTK